MLLPRPVVAAIDPLFPRPFITTTIGYCHWRMEIARNTGETSIAIEHRNGTFENGNLPLTNFSLFTVSA